MENEHWSKAFLKQEISSISPLNEGGQHKIDLITLIDKSKWICKKFSPQTWLGPTNVEELKLSEALATEVADKLGISLSAYRWHGSPILKINEQPAMIVPYCEGECLVEFSEHQSFLLGNRLAEIHLLKPFSTSAKPFPAIILAKEEQYPSWLEQLAIHCNSYRYYEEEKWVFSHRDIHASNIVWPDIERPHLIDWESAGLIHPTVELIGLAANCAGLALCKFLPGHFKAALLGYGQLIGYLPKIDSILWELTLHSWLLWFAYSLRQGWEKEAKQTLESIELIKNKMEDLKQIYAAVYSSFYQK